MPNLLSMPAPAPQAFCASCGHNSTARRDARGAFCRHCGNPEVQLNIDRVPYDVWATLVDNEDSNGRVPADVGWEPNC